MVIDAKARQGHPGVVHRVVIILYPGIQPLDVVGPHEVFIGANRCLDAAGSDAPRYRCELVARSAGPVTAESGLALHAPGALPDPAGIGTLLLPGGSGVQEASQDTVLVDWIRSAAGTADRVATVCSGTFLAGAAGLLDGRRVTTHWARASQLAQRHPEAEVDADPIFVRDGELWTSAGVTAGIDLALALVEEDHDAEVAQTIARWVVMFLRRPGGQSQFAAPVWSEPARQGPVRDAQDLVHTDPSADLRVPALARRVGMSPRHFSRVFTEQVGASPGQYVTTVRVETARRLLEQEPDATTAAVARQCGFGTAETMRRAFLRRVGVPPEQYRRRFAVVS
jgi:transcriptional regulator GlxA family with amidase domain